MMPIPYKSRVELFPSDSMTQKYGFSYFFLIGIVVIDIIVRFYVLTGLEIDSAKSGIRPDLDEYLTHKTVKRSDFLK